MEQRNGKVRAVRRSKKQMLELLKKFEQADGTSVKAFCELHQISKAAFYSTRSRYRSSCNNPLDKISEEEIIDWCEIDPLSRYNSIIEYLEPFKAEQPVKSEPQAKGKLILKPIMYALLSKAPERQSVLNLIEAAIYPSMWSDSRADALEYRVDPIKKLTEYDDPVIQSWAQTTLEKLRLSIVKERDSERVERHRESSSFE